MEIINTIFYTIITLGILIFVHELGHFLAAKITGMRVDRFSMGFPPRAFGKKIGDTDYCISWIPIGGYVKIAGMIDESFDTEYLNSEPQPWEFRAKTLWARTFVISAGVLMNIILAIMIFWSTNYFRGKVIRETTEIGYVVPDSPADKSGLQAGDKIISINGQQVTHWEEIQTLLSLESTNNNITLNVDRAGQSKQVFISHDSIPSLSERTFGIIESHTAAIILSIEPHKPAEKTGLKAGDIIVSLDKILTQNEYQVIKIIREHTNKEMEITWKREEEWFSGKVTPNEEGRIGISISSSYVGPRKHLKYSIFESFPVGVNEFYQWGKLSVFSINQIIQGRVSFKESVGGPIKIAQLATQSAKYGILSYLTFIAILSMSLAFLNILPIPALDGGHLIMMLTEKIFKKEIPIKVKLIIQQAGFIFLLAFMAFVIYNDIMNF